MIDTTTSNGEAREQLLAEVSELRESFRTSRDLNSPEFSFFRDLLMEAISSLTRTKVIATVDCRNPAHRGDVDLVPLSEIGSVITALEDTDVLSDDQIATVRRVVDATKAKIDELKLLEDDQK